MKRKKESEEIMKDLMDKYIRFDWASKRLLRQKANFSVLEGFLTVLLNEKVTILEILESEGNQQFAEDKFNWVDIKARNSKDEIIIVEIQNTRELYYLERILYGVAKAITEHIDLGKSYEKVKKSTQSASFISISGMVTIISIMVRLTLSVSIPVTC